MSEMVPITTARERLAEVIDEVRMLGRRVPLSRHGKPVAVIMPVEDAEAVEAAEDVLDKALAVSALAGWLDTRETVPGEKVFGPACEGIDVVPDVARDVMELPGQTMGTLLSLAEMIAGDDVERAREVSEKIFSLRADGCRLVWAEVAGQRVVVAMAG